MREMCHKSGVPGSTCGMQHHRNCPPRPTRVQAPSRCGLLACEHRRRGRFSCLDGSVRGDHRAGRPLAGAVFYFPAPTDHLVALSHPHLPHPPLTPAPEGGGLHEAEVGVRCGERERGGARRFVPVAETLFAGGPARSGGNGPQNDRFAAETRRRRLGNWLSNGAPC